MNAQQLKNSILQEAIEGRLVPQDPNDEPASVLLERIRKEKAKLVKEKKLKKKDLVVIPISEDEKPFEIPKSWEWVRIYEIASSQLGKTLDKGKQTGKEYPYLCSINVYWDGICLDNVKTFLLKDDELLRYKLQKGDLLVCEGGDYGRCSVWDIDIEMYYQNALHRLRFYDGISPYYFKHIFEFYRKSNYIVGQGQTIKHFTYANMKTLSFPLPPLAEQHRIVAKIEELLPKVEEYGKAQEALDKLNKELPEKLKKSVLQEAIEGRLVPQDPNDEPASVLLERIRKEKAKLVKEKKIKADKNESRIYRTEDGHWMEHFEDKKRQDVSIDDEIPFDIPESWGWCRINTLFYVWSARRVHEKDWRKSGIPFYRAREIGKLAEFGAVNNELFIDKSLYDRFSKSGLPYKDDLMVTAVGTLGRVYRVKDNDVFYFKDGSVLCLYNYMKLDPIFYKYVIESPVFVNQYIRESQGTTVATLTIVRMNNYLIPLPPLAEQHRIVTKLESILTEIEKLK